MPPIYMDANATTPVLPAVVEAMQPYWSDRFGNASAVHGFGRRARGAVETAREQVAQLLNAKPAELTFTSGGTESDNLALSGLLQPGDHLLVSTIEHDAILHTADALEARGIQVTRVACDRDGVVQPAAVAEAMTPSTRLVSMMAANNETGVVQPVAQIAAIAHRAGAWMHTDAVQVAGKLPLDVGALGCDLLSLSSHKMHGPQGVGALWGRAGVPLQAVQHGGSHERRRRAGTENVPGIVGFGEAAKRAQTWLAEGGATSLKAMRDRLEAALQAAIADLEINGGGVDRLPNTSSMRFAGVKAEELVISLDMQGLAISGGSACQSGAVDPSHVLRAMGLSADEAKSSIRISLSHRNTAEEIEAVVPIVTEAVARLRRR